MTADDDMIDFTCPAKHYIKSQHRSPHRSCAKAFIQVQRKIVRSHGIAFVTSEECVSLLYLCSEIQHKGAGLPSVFLASQRTRKIIYCSTLQSSGRASTT